VPSSWFDTQTEPAPQTTSHGCAPTRIRRTTRIRFGSMRSTVLVPKPSTQIAPAPEARPHGCSPTRTRPVTRFVAGLTRTTVADP
jgi:hypothetical protein